MPVVIQFSYSWKENIHFKQYFKLTLSRKIKKSNSDSLK